MAVVALEAWAVALTQPCLHTSLAAWEEAWVVEDGEAGEVAEAGVAACTLAFKAFNDNGAMGKGNNVPKLQTPNHYHSLLLLQPHW